MALVFSDTLFIAVNCKTPKVILNESNNHIVCIIKKTRIDKFTDCLLVIVYTINDNNSVSADIDVNYLFSLLGWR